MENAIKRNKDNGEFNDTQQSGGSQDRKLVTQPDS